MPRKEELEEAGSCSGNCTDWVCAEQCHFGQGLDAAELQGVHLGPSRLSSLWNDFCPIRPTCCLCHKLCLKSPCHNLPLTGGRPGHACSSQHASAMCHFGVLQKPVTVAFNRNISRALQRQLLLTQSSVRSIIVVIFFKMFTKQTQFLLGEIKLLNYSSVELLGFLERVPKCSPWRLAKGQPRQSLFWKSSRREVTVLGSSLLELPLGSY